MSPHGSRDRCRLHSSSLPLPLIHSACQLAFLETHPGVDAVGAGVCLMTAAGDLTSVMTLPEHPALVKWSMLFYCSIVHPTVMAKREVRNVKGWYLNPRVSLRRPVVCSECFALNSLEFQRRTQLCFPSVPLRPLCVPLNLYSSFVVCVPMPSLCRSVLHTAARTVQRWPL